MPAKSQAVTRDPRARARPARRVHRTGAARGSRHANIRVVLRRRRRVSRSRRSPARRNRSSCRLPRMMAATSSTMVTSTDHCQNVTTSTTRGDHRGHDRVADQELQPAAAGGRVQAEEQHHRGQQRGQLVRRGQHQDRGHDQQQQPAAAGRPELGQPARGARSSGPGRGGAGCGPADRSARPASTRRSSSAVARPDSARWSRCAMASAMSASAASDGRGRPLLGDRAGRLPGGQVVQLDGAQPVPQPVAPCPAPWSVRCAGRAPARSAARRAAEPGTTLSSPAKPITSDQEVRIEPSRLYLGPAGARSPPNGSPVSSPHSPR